VAAAETRAALFRGAGERCAIRNPREWLSEALSLFTSTARRDGGQSARGAVTGRSGWYKLHEAARGAALRVGRCDVAAGAIPAADDFGSSW